MVLLLTCLSLNVPFKICSRAVFGLAAKSVYSFINLLFSIAVPLPPAHTDTPGLLVFFFSSSDVIQELVSVRRFDQGRTTDLILRSGNKRASSIPAVGERIAVKAV